MLYWCKELRDAPLIASRSEPTVECSSSKLDGFAIPYRRQIDFKSNILRGAIDGMNPA